MNTKQPHQIISGLISERRQRSDDEILAELKALAPLKDEDDSAWDDDAYWEREAYLFLALASETHRRRLRIAIRLLLDRASYGDPGEIMRGLRHSLEGIANPEWAFLADVCMAAAKSSRLGTRLWALNQLTILEDPRAREAFEDAIASGIPDIASEGKIGLRRLEKHQATNNPMDRSGGSAAS